MSSYSDILSLGDDVSNIIGTAVAGARAQRGIDNARIQVEQGAKEATGIYQPYQDIGKEYTQGLARDVKGGAYDVTPYQAYRPTEAQPGVGGYGTQPGDYQTPEFNYQRDPGYQAQLQAGNQQLQSAAGGAGMLLSGATQKALARYGVGLAAQDYQNAFNRYTNQRDFGYGVYQGNLGQYNTNRANAQNMYQVGLGQYNQNRQFGSAENLASYNAQNQQSANRFNRNAALGNLGMGSAAPMSDILQGKYAGLANLELQKGGVGAATANQMAGAVGGLTNQMASISGGSSGGGGGMNLGSLGGMLGGGGGSMGGGGSSNLGQGMDFGNQGFISNYGGSSGLMNSNSFNMESPGVTTESDWSAIG
jgi:uncharacterized membrane protein YgcG